MKTASEVMYMKYLIPVFLIILIAGCMPEQPPAAPPTVPETPQVPVEEPEAPSVPQANETPAAPQTPVEVEKPISGGRVIYVNRYTYSGEDFRYEEGSKVTWISNVTRGTTVVWVNNDTKMHLIVIKKPVYVKGERLEEFGANWSYTFERFGAWEYVDSIYGIRGIINVE